MTVTAFLDFGFGEMLLIAVVALLVFGGDLPRMMRKLGQHYGAFRRSMDDYTRPVREELRRMADMPHPADGTVPLDQQTPPEDAEAPDTEAGEPPAGPAVEAPPGDTQEPPLEPSGEGSQSESPGEGQGPELPVGGVRPEPAPRRPAGAAEAARRPSPRPPLDEPPPV
jgi:sec-independent protein translocase protein TatA